MANYNDLKADCYFTSQNNKNEELSCELNAENYKNENIFFSKH